MRRTMRVKLRVAAAGFGLILGALPAVAHHSFAAEYDEKPVKVTGIVKKVEWTNPHSRMYLDVKDAIAARSQSGILNSAAPIICSAQVGRGTPSRKVIRSRSRAGGPKTVPT